MTTFLDRLLGRPEPVKMAKAVTALGAWGTGVPLSSMADTPQRKAAVYLKAYKVGWFHKAGRKIADDIASLDWSVSDGDMEEGEEETTLDRPALDLPFDSLSPIDQFQRLLERPNPYQTGRQLIRKTEVRLDFAGAAAWYMEGATSGLPTGLYGISPARMWPAYDKAGVLIGWVMDKDAPSGGVPFDTSEILWFSTGNADDNDIWGTSVVEAVYSQVPLTDLMARHTANVLTTGGRLAGMLWPKERALTEAEYADAQRAWRNVASDPDAGKRLLVFPEPMEYASGASTPAEIGIPELAVLNRDEILTAFPVSPYRLGVPMPGGLNSGEVRREDRRDYWEETIHPRADLLEEAIQVGLLSLYEEKMGQTFDFELAEPNMDDAASLTEKAKAYKELVAIGFDPKETVSAVGLTTIKWLGLPDLLDPAKQAQAQAEAREALANQPKPDPAAAPKPFGKAVKTREDVAKAQTQTIAEFFADQRDRVTAAIRAEYAGVKSTERVAWATKADPKWWDGATEDSKLRNTVRGLYVAAGRSSLQVVADQLGRFVYGDSVDRVLADLLAYGGERIADINARTLQAISIELAEGTRRGYSVNQLIDGVAAEGYKGVLNVGLENGVGVWGDARAETIARTETMLSYNRATLDAYREFQVERVTAYDGDDDDVCAERNGQVFSIDEAFAIADHPNGTLDWAPALDGKSWHEPKPTSVIVNNYLEPGKPPETKVYNEFTLPQQAAPVTNVTVSPAAVEVKVPDVHVTNQPPGVTVHVDAPNIKSPDVRVINEVASPAVTVNVPKQAAPVVNVPAQAAPVVNVKAAPAPNVTVNTPDTLRITSMPDRVTRRKVDRDKQGRITDTTDVEVDG